MDVRGRVAIREAVQITEVGVDWHRIIVTDFAMAAKTKTALEKKEF